MLKSELVAKIYAAFRDVRLDDGIGFYEADCIDDYISPDDPVYIDWKRRDERENWGKLLPVLLTEGVSERVHSGNWYAMDPKGKRFHLPCYLLLDIDNKLKGENPLVISSIFEPPDLSFFEILIPLQKQTVIDFLVFKEERFLKEKIDFDYDNYGKAKEVLLKRV